MNQYKILTFISTNIIYTPGYKGVILTPNDVIITKTGHCWEYSCLVNHLFTESNIESYSVYIECGNTTHMTNIFNIDDIWYSIELCRNDLYGISQPYVSKLAVLRHIYNIFVMSEGIPSIYKIGTITPTDDNEESFYHKILQMDTIYM